jgi:phosphoribosylformimino-5-aminoimidazole carboxamide ribotide isomerase
VGSDPGDVVGALLDLHPFPAVYIADLDAIEGRGEHFQTIARLAKAYHPIEFWVDAGSCTPQGLHWWQSTAGVKPVIGSESQSDIHVLRSMLERACRQSLLLSLDYRKGKFLGPPALLATPDIWPDRVLVMSLDRVGTAAGPDFERLSAIGSLAPRERLFAAGGIRDAKDLERLYAPGIRGVLLASSLHNGRIGRDELARYSASSTTC